MTLRDGVAGRLQRQSCPLKGRARVTPALARRPYRLDSNPPQRRFRRDIAFPPLDEDPLVTVKTLQEFVSNSKEKDMSGDAFELESSHMLEARVDGLIWAKAGSMIARKGGLKFTRQGLMEQGLGNLLKKAVSGEGMTLMKIEGQGRVYLADVGKKITLLRLQGESIYVNGNDVLATESTIANEIKMMRKAAGMMTGGLFNVKLSGHGLVAITSHYEPLTLPVNASTGPVFTDPNATVAWSGSLSPEIVTDINIKTLIGRGSGESIQLRFAGEGWVVVQPYEEVYFQQSGGSSGGGLLSVLTD
ncbi:MAG: AIM24 family protein [Lysobacter sp.]|nr:MAG: AIM24 family protein [Lysobacter sp.]